MQRIQKVLRKNVKEEEPIWVDFMPPGILKKMSSRELADDYASGYEAQIPLIETQIFLPWLQTQAQQRGVQFHQKEIKNFAELKGFDIIINCSALGSRELCKDNMLVPVRGQVALLSPKPNQDIFLDNETPLYIVPRKDAIIVGGTYEEGIETETIEPQTIERILANAYKVFPELQQQKLIGSWAGLRPYRPTVRVEKENNIIHNYGHGGSGFTLAFGCAKEVANMIA